MHIMKKILLAMMSASLLFGCKYFNHNTQTVELEGDTTEIAVEDPSLFNEDIAVEEGQEVWKSFGGTYFFWGDGEQFLVDFPLPQDGGSVKVSYKGEEYEATADEDTGKIVAKDSLGHVVFKGYMYDGGNTIKGLFKGEPVELGGSGD